MKHLRIKGIEKFSNRWIAIDPKGNKIITGGSDLKKVLKEASKSVNKPVVMRVPNLEASFSPNVGY